MARVIARALRYSGSTWESFLVEVENNSYTIKNEKTKEEHYFVKGIQELQFFNEYDPQKPPDILPAVFATPCLRGYAGTAANPNPNPSNNYLETSLKVPTSFIHTFSHGGTEYFGFRCLLRVFLHYDREGRVHERQFPASARGNQKVEKATQFFPSLVGILAADEAYSENQQPLFQKFWFWQTRESLFGDGHEDGYGNRRPVTFEDVFKALEDDDQDEVIRRLSLRGNPNKYRPSQSFLDQIGTRVALTRWHEDDIRLRMNKHSDGDDFYRLAFSRKLANFAPRSSGNLFPPYLEPLTNDRKAPIKHQFPWPKNDSNKLEIKQTALTPPTPYRPKCEYNDEEKVAPLCVDYLVTVEDRQMNTEFVLNHWGTSVADSAAVSIAMVKDGSGFSIVPRIQTSENPKWTLVLRLIDLVHQEDWQPDEDTDQVLMPTLPKQVVDAAVLIPNQPITVNLEWIQIQTLAGKKVKADGKLIPPSLPTVGAPDWLLHNTADILMNLVVEKVKEQPKFQLGALSFGFAEGESSMEIRTRYIEEPGRIIAPRVKVDWKAIPLIALGPGGQDDLPGEEVTSPKNLRERTTPQDLREWLKADVEAAFPRARPLVYTTTSLPSSTYALEIQEKAGVETDQSLKLIVRLLKNPNNENAQALILDREPFSWTWTEIKPFVNGSGVNAQVVAEWDSADPEGARWRLPGQDNEAEWLVQPQAIGEAMEKFKGNYDIDESELVDYRFSPMGRLKVRLEDRARNATPAWDIRLLLNDPTPDLSGVALTEAEYELLYGMQNQLSRADLRIADLESRRGQPRRLSREACGAAFDEDKEDTEAFRIQLQNKYRSWAAAYLAWKTRLGYWEVRQTLLPDQNLFLDEGIRFRLREKVAKAPIIGFDDNFFDDQGLAGGPTWAFESQNILKSVLRNKDSTSGELEGLAFTAIGGWGKQTARFDNNRTSIIAEVSAGRTHFYSIERIGRISVFWNRAKHVIIYERTVLPADQFADNQDHHLGRPIIRKVDEYVELLEPERTYPEHGAPQSTVGFVCGSFFRDKVVRVDSNWGRDVGSVGWEVPLWNAEASKNLPNVYPKPQFELKAASDPDIGPATIQCGIDNPENVYFFTSTQPNDGANTDAWQPFIDVDYADLPDDRPDEDRLHRSDFQRAEDDRMTLPTPPTEPPGLNRFTWRLAGHERVNLTFGRLPKAITAALDTVTMMRAEHQRKLENRNAVQERIALSQVGEAANAGRAAQDMYNHLLDDLLRNTDWFVEGNPGASKKNLEVIARDWFVQNKQGMERVYSRIEDFQAKAEDLLKKYAGKIDFCELVKSQVKKEVDRRIAQLNQPLDQLQNEASAAVREAFQEIRRQGPTEDRLEELRSKLNDLVLKPIQTISRAPGILALKHQELLAEADRLIPAIDRLEASVSGEIEEVNNEINSIKTEVIQDIQALIDLVNQGSSKIDEMKEKALALLQKLPKIKELEQTLEENSRKALKLIERAKTKLKGITSRRWAPLAKNALVHLTNLENAIRRGLPAARHLLSSIGRILRNLPDDLERCRNNVGNIGEKIKNDLTQLQNLVAKFELDIDLTAEFAAIRGIVAKARKELAEVFETGSAGHNIKEKLIKIAGEASKLAESLDEYINELSLANLDELERQILAQLTNLNPIRDEIKELPNLAGAYAKKLCDQLGKLEFKLDELVNEIKQRFQTIRDAILNGLQNLPGATLDELLESLTDLISGISGSLTDSMDQVADWLSDYASEVAGQAGDILARAGDTIIRLIRAMGDPPDLPDLNFNRLGLGYYFDDLLSRIRLTPSTALVDRFGDYLRGIGVGLPTLDLDLDFTPPRLPNLNLGSFDLSRILPDLGGIKLDGFFKGRKMTSFRSDAIKVTHGIDKRNKRAWAQADLNMPLGKGKLLDTEIFSVRVDKADLTGKLRLETDLSGNVKRVSEGKIDSDWSVDVGGFRLLEIEEVLIEYRDGQGLDYHINPQKVKLTGALQFLGRMLEKLSDPDSGLTLEMLERDGKPYGVEARLDLPIPDLAFGAFNITGLQFGAHVSLLMEDEFSLRLRTFLGQESAPFMITVAFLGGAGWIDAQARYLPGSGYLATQGTVGIGAAAGGGFALGPIRGHVTFFLGIRATFASETGRRNRFEIAAILIINGGVSVWGFIHVGLNLTLAVTYDNTGRALARGSVTISVRIGRFFKKKFSSSFTYTLAKGNGGQSAMAVSFATSESALESARTPDLIDTEPEDLIDRYKSLYSHIQVQG